MAKAKLELTWVGKDVRPKLEPRILLEDPTLGYHGAASTGATLDNRLIFGDNLLALKALEQEFRGKVKCVFIDPPYNTGSAFTHYDDGLEHSIWLSLMRDRLEVIKSLMAADGSLWITIDDNEAHYLKVLCDETFGRPNFIANFIWQKRRSRENRRKFSINHDHMLLYTVNKQAFEAQRNMLPINAAVMKRYKNPDIDPRGAWQSVSLNAQDGHATEDQFYTITLPSGRRVDPPKGRCWLYVRRRLDEEITKGNIWFGKAGNNVPRVKKFLADSDEAGLTPETIWPALEVSTNDEAKKSLIRLLPYVQVFDNPKPEALLQRILHIATNPGDLVLDSFAGSGTTGAVAHKMGRRWIMVELGEHCHTHIIPRLKKVIDGEDAGGISEAVNWQGGGAFRYFRLAPSLLLRDAFEQWVINPAYNADMLAAAVAKLEGFRYEPSREVYWQQGRSTETDYIFVTTQTMSESQLEALSEEVGSGRTLLVCCSAFRGGADRHANLTLHRIPKVVLDKCEWGRDDYSLGLADAVSHSGTEQAEAEPAAAGVDA